MVMIYCNKKQSGLQLDEDETVELGGYDNRLLASIITITYQSHVIDKRIVAWN